MNLGIKKNPFKKTWVLNSKSAIAQIVFLVFQFQNLMAFGEFPNNEKPNLEIGTSVFYSYYENYNYGKYYAALNNHSKAYSFYKKSIELTVQPGQKLLCDFVTTCNRLNRFSESQFWIIYMIEKFGLDYMFFEYNKVIESSNRGHFSEIKNRETEFLCRFNIYSRLKDIDDIKYLYKSRIFYLEELKRLSESNSDAEKIIAIKGLLNRMDDVEIKQLINKLILKFKFPSEYDLGVLGYGMFIELFRDVYYVNDSTKSILDNALINLKIEPLTYATIIDSKYKENRMLEKNKAVQIFPYRNFGANLTVKDNLITIRDQIYNIDSVDFRRQKVGLPPLWMDAIIRNYKLPEEYVEWRRDAIKKE